MNASNEQSELSKRMFAKKLADEYSNEINGYDPVINPKHYEIIDGVESIQVIACSLTAHEWRGFCLGSILKYRIRAGKKDNMDQDISKACYYEELFEKHRHLCKEVRSGV